MSCIIELKDVNFSAQGRSLVQDFSYQFEEGQTTALIGPSGSGKSTVLKLSAALFPPDDGEVLFRGREVFHMGRQENIDFRREAAVVFQDSALWANQNLYQILELPLRLHFPKRQEEWAGRIESVVAEVGYRKALVAKVGCKKALEVRPSQLSMGEQKLIAFARAMMCRPRLLYLDEWTESLDQGSAQRLIELVKKLKAGGVSIILVSHNIGIIRDLADAVVTIQAGRMSRLFTREQIKNDEDLSRYLEKDIAV